MKNHGDHRCSHRRRHWTLWLIGVGSAIWLLLRSGTNPRRLAYPCQQAAMATTTAFLGYLATLVGVTQLYRLGRRKTLTGIALVSCALLLMLTQTGSTVRSGAAALTLDLPGWTSATAVSNVFVVPDVPVPECSLASGSLPSSGPCNEPSYALPDSGVDRLVSEMENRGDYFFATAGHGGIVAVNDVVVIKINDQWAGYGDGSGSGRLSTNTDVLKGLIWQILQHPDGFSGEVVVAENTQGVNFEWDTTPANSEDRNQTYQDVANVYQGLGYPVSLYRWDFLNESDTPLVSGGPVGGGYPNGEYINGHDDDAYILLEDPGGSGTDELSYPKFETAGGNQVSMRYGVWDGSSYDSDQLTLINLPVLKKHGMAGSTICWKNLIGFITISDDWRRFGDWDEMHDFFWGYTGNSEPDYGLVGRQMALVRTPDLNLVDAIWVATDDNTSGGAVRQNVLVASSDPFAADWYASEYVLRPLASWDAQGSSAAASGTFRNATLANQNSAAAVWSGSYPYIDLQDSYSGSTPSSAERDQMNAYVVGASSSCILTCSASVPASAAVDEEIAFSATAVATGCSGQPAFAWNLGDGTTAAGSDTTHSYGAAGNYGWTLTVTIEDQVCTRSGTIEVGQAGGAYDFLVPAVVHAAGAAGTQWRTSVVCLNLGAASNQLTLTLVTGSGPLVRTVTLDARATIEWTDIVVDLFDTSEATSGALHIAAQQPLLATSRTYNQAPTGTFGQYLPALAISDGLASGDIGYLLQLKGGDDFRTNVGYACLGDTTCEVELVLYDSWGATIGDARYVTVSAGEWSQDNDIFTLTGAGAQELAYATLEAMTGESFWAYASVVDNNTGDATTIPVIPGAG